MKLRSLRNYVYLVFIVQILFVCQPVFAGPTCESYYKRTPLVHNSLKSLQERFKSFINKGKSILARESKNDGFDQWLRWEQMANLPQFLKPTDPISVPISKIMATSADIIISDSVPNDLRKFLQPRENQLLWFKHPDNQLRDLPHFDDPIHGTIKAYYTASRSIAFKIGNHAYSIKMGTSHPEGPKGRYDVVKADTREDIRDAKSRMEYINRVDSEIGLDPDLILAKEVVIVADKNRPYGYLIRDMSFLEDKDHYYLPAFSLPYVGRELAERHNENPETFWQKYYAEALGRAKAKFLLRYGLEMEVPNPQNILIQLDKNFYPTGAIVLRDLSDTELVERVAIALGEQNQLQRDQENNVFNKTTLYEEKWNVSAWKFNLPEKGFTSETLRTWGAAHNNAYKDEMRTALSVGQDRISFGDYRHLLIEKENSRRQFK